MPPLPRVPYLTDNPFRLLGVGSATPLSVLRQQARAAERSLQVGLPTSVYHPELLGDEELSACSSQIRALSTNARQLLLFRIFWPLDGPAAEAERDSDAEDRDLARVWQQDFLRNWLAFLTAPGPETLEQALLDYECVDADEDLSTGLRELLLSDGFPDTDLEDLIADAWQEARACVYGFAARMAAEVWQSGATDQAAELIQTLAEQGWPDEVVSEALTVFVPVGEALCRELRALAVPTAAELVVHGLTMPECLTRLQTLIQQLKPYLSQAGLWNSAWSRCIGEVGGAAHDAALHLAETTQAYSAAATLLTQLLTWPISETWREEVEKDLARMRAALSLPRAAPPAPPKQRPTVPLFRRWQTIWNVALALFLIVVIGFAYKRQSDEAARIPPFYLSEPPTAADPEPAAKPATAAKPQPESRAEEVSRPSEDPAADQPAPAASSSESDTTVSGLDEIRPEAIPAPAATAPANPIQIAPDVDHSALKQELESMKELIQIGKMQLNLQRHRLNADDAAIDEEKAVIDGLSSSIRQAKTDLEKYERDSQSGLEVDQEAYQRALDVHNTLVDRYNERLPGLRQLIARRNELSEQYNELLKKHNRLVDDYNLKLTTLSGGG